MSTARLLTLAAVLSAAVVSTASARVAIVPMPRRPSDQYVWVEPVYRVEIERVWVPTRIERVAERVWIPATYGWRTVIYIDECGNRVERREYGELTPAHYETRYRDVVIEGRYETRTRRILVTPGHWEYIGPRPVPIEPPVIIQPAPNPGTVGVEGYAPAPANPDAGKFSPLYDWPK